MVNPLTAPAGAIYFATSYVVRKHDLAYVCRQRFQVREGGWVVWGVAGCLERF
jgi:hypothetical protein